MLTNNNGCPRYGNPKKTLLTVAAALFTCFSVYAQNLVPNPSWEQMASCPGTYQYTPVSWFNPNTASPDYFNPCASGYNHAQPGFARTGTCYVDGRFYGIGGGWYEYSEVQLSSPMVAGTVYHVGVWYRGSGIPVDTGFGILITPNIVNSGGFGPFTGYVPQIKAHASDSISGDWALLSSTYTATGGEQYITLGCFLPWQTMVSLGLSGGGWAYFDDAFVYADGTPNASPAEALNFDGYDDYVEVQDTANALTGLESGKFTLEAWINPTGYDYSGYSSIFRKSGDYNLYLTQDQNTGLGILTAQVWTNGNNDGTLVDYVGSTEIPDSVWTHVAFSYDSASQVAQLYVNGVPETMSIYSDWDYVQEPLWIGTSLNYGNYFWGSMDEVKIWKRALCGPEILNNFNGDLQLPQQDLVLYYKFNQGLAGAINVGIDTAIDASGFGYVGILTNFGLINSTSNWVEPGPIITGRTAPPFNAPQITISGDTAVCNGSSITLTATGQAVSYAWTGGPDTPVYTITPTAITTYSVQGEDNNHCATNVATTTVTVKPLPVIAVNSDTICPGSSFTITPSGADVYFYSSGSNVVSPTTDTSYYVTGATYYLAGTTFIGCQSADTAVSRVTIRVPFTPAIQADKDTICTGDSSHICTIGNYASYVWNTGETDQCIFTGYDGNYYVTVTDNNGCTASSNHVAVTVHIPTPVDVSVHNDTLRVNSAGAYQWYWNDNAVAGETNSTYVVLTSGTYSVRLTDAEGCSIFSPDLIIGLTTGISEINADQLQIYPSPATDYITIKADNDFIGSACVIRDVLGRNITTMSLQSENTQVSLNGWAAGIYNLAIQSPSGEKITRQFIIQK